MLMDAVYTGLDSFCNLGYDTEVVMKMFEERKTVQLLLCTSCSEHKNINRCDSYMLMTYMVWLYFLDCFTIRLAG